LGLGKRPSPIKGRDNYVAKPKSDKPPKNRARQRISLRAAQTTANERTAKLNGHTVVKPVTKPIPAPIARTVSPFKTCQFITTDGRPWTKCEAETQPGSSYCLHHHERCHRKPEEVARERAEREAA
jgi:hypothetical protein